MKQEDVHVFLVFSIFIILPSCTQETTSDNSVLCKPILDKPTAIIERGFDACGGENYEGPYKDIQAAKNHLNDVGVCVFSIKSEVKSSVFLTCDKSYNGTYFFAKIPSKQVRLAKKNGWE